jgi:hypothetical protein
MLRDSATALANATEVKGGLKRLSSCHHAYNDSRSQIHPKASDIFEVFLLKQSAKWISVVFLSDGSGFILGPCFYSLRDYCFGYYRNR